MSKLFAYVFILIFIISNQDVFSQLSGYKIVIDPGHGGKQSGTISVDGESEKKLNLEIAIRLMEKLLYRGADVEMTRANDTQLDSSEPQPRNDVEARMNFINNENPDVAVSLHLNGSTLKVWQGTEVLWHNSDKSKEFANCVYLRLLDVTRFSGLGVNYDDELAVLKTNSWIPTILTEALYITDYRGSTFINNPTNQTSLAIAHADGIQDYLYSLKPDLITVSQSLSKNSLPAGSTLMAYCAEENLGHKSAEANVISIHLSADDVLTPGTNDDRYIDEISIPAVTAKTCSIIYSKSITIPPNITPGIYYIYFSADGGEKIDEISEKNNYSSVQIAVTDSPTINPVTNLTASTGNNQVTLGWSGPSSGFPSSYDIYISNSEVGSYSYYDSSISTSKTVTGLTNGTLYWFYITAVYDSGISDPSNKVSAMPSGLTLTSNDDCSGARLLTSSTSLNYLENQNVNNATNSGYSKATCDNYTGTPALADVWYYFKATATTHTVYVDPNGSQLDAVIAVYSSCLNNTELACSDITGINGTFSYLSISGLTIGSFYYIRVYDYGLQTTNGDFRICVTGENSNNNCAITSITPSSETLGPASYSTPPGSYDIYFNTQANCSFTTLESCSWLTVIPVSGTTNANGQAFLNYSIQENTSTSERQCTLYINDSPVMITQRGSVVETGQADLTIRYNSHTPNVILLGTLISVNYTRQNIGNKSASSSNIGVYISRDEIFDSNTDQLITYWPRGTSAPNSIDTDNLNFNIPHCYRCGSYYIYLLVDYQNSIDESDENNNSVYFPIQITGCTDCSYSIPSKGITFESAGGSGNFNLITTDCCEWTASTTDNFITIVNSSGTGSGVINYSVSPSSSGGSRSGTIKVSGQTHTIIQNCNQVCNNSQSFEWAVKAGSPTLSDAANDIAIDNSGNLYMTGDIQGSATFGGNILTTPSTAPDAFVAKYNSSGQIQWAVRYGDTDQEYGTGIATDSNGDVYVIGNSANEVTIGNTTLTANGINEGITFLIKLNSNGILQWVKKINALYSGYTSDIEIDSSNNVFVTGSLSDYKTGNGNGLFVAKYNISGIQNWYKTYGFGFFVKDAYGIAVDNSGNIFMSGRYMQNITLGSITLTASTNLDIDGFICKLDINGNVMWANQLMSPGQGQDELRSIAVDAENNIYTIGKVDSSAIVGNIIIPLSKSSKLIIIKFDQNGNPKWAKTSKEGNQIPLRIIKGDDNNIYFTGFYGNRINVDSKIIVSNGSNDGFLGRINADGIVKWLKGFGGILDDGVFGVVTNSSNDIFVAGSFKGTTEYGNTTLTSSGSDDIYLAKFIQCEPPNTNISYTGSLILCSGESKSLLSEYCFSYKYQWFRDNIKIEGANLPSYLATQAGSYTILVSLFDGCDSTSPTVVLTPYMISSPTITRNGKLLLSSPSTRYQWNLNDNPIKDATNQYYEPIVSGAYSVTATDNSGCSSISDIFSVVITELPDLLANGNIRFYPNPAKDYVTIESTQPAIIQFSTNLGQQIKTIGVNEGKTNINISDFKKGIYLVRAKSETEDRVIKFVKE